jgi:AraC-like DNA-binding protein
MAEQAAAGGPAADPHHGPIKQDCPVECLQAVLSQAPYRALARAQDTYLPPPRTVGDVIRLYVRRDLRGIRGLGPRRISEIETALVLAGFDLSAHQLSRQPAAAPVAGDTDSLPRDPAAATARPTAGCPVCGSPADFPPLPPQASVSPPPRLVQAAERTARVLAWMAANCHRRDVTVAEVAGVAGLSPRRLQAIFKRDTGRGPLRLMADMRMHRVHLALTGRAPAPASLAEAARLAGHSRVHRFRVAYRERYGQYPALPAQPAGGSGRPGRARRSKSPEDTARK